MEVTEATILGLAWPQFLIAVLIALPLAILIVGIFSFRKILQRKTLNNLRALQFDSDE